MGAFLLINKSEFPDQKLKQISKVCTTLFSDKQSLPLAGEFDLGSHHLYLYKKRFYSATNFLIAKDDVFVASTGSLFYKGNSGVDALRAIADDFLANKKIENHFKGHFFVILKTNSNIYIFTDYYGIYPVYHNFNMSVISSSFLICAELSPQLSISKNELFEYLFNGFWYGKQTLFNEILLLKDKGITNLTTNVFQSFSPDLELVITGSTDRIVASITEKLSAHFIELVSAYEILRSGLSGGYDSRLLLAILLKLNKRPELYVNGIPGSTDITCAQAIVKGLGLQMDIVYFYEAYGMALANTQEFFLNRFFFFDGLGAGGIFDNYSDLEYRLLNPGSSFALLNGAGGEIYREAWNLPNRSFTLDSFISSRYERPGMERYLVNYTKSAYLSHIKTKTIHNLGKEVNKLNRIDVEKLHPARYKAIHFIMSSLSKLNPFIMPFYEPSLIEQSVSIPIAAKYFGKLNKALISHFFAELTRFQSSYGYSFAQNVPKKIALKESIFTNMPLSLRPFLKNFKKSKRLPVNQFGTDLLAKPIIDEMIPGNLEYLPDYMRIDLISDVGLKSRALTLEFLFRYLKV